MFGHSPASVGRAIAAQAERGLTVMLPSADAVEVGPLLAERFCLPFWQMTTTASATTRKPVWNYSTCGHQLRSQNRQPC